MARIPPPINIITNKPLSPNQYYCLSAQPKPEPKTRSGQNGNFAAGYPVPGSVPPKLRLDGTPKCAASGIENQIEGLDPELMPKHVALFLDGHRRWAKSKGVSKIEGYFTGIKNLEKLGLQFQKCGVETLTIFNFHSGAWNRPKEDVDYFFKLAGEMVHANFEELMRKDVRVTVLGDRSRFPPNLVDLIHMGEERAKGNKGVHLVVTADYNGRYDITEAAKRIAGKVRDGVLDAEDIDEALFAQHLQTSGLQFPDPDLLIRTGGKCKLSNFMLWQMAYTELYFCDKLFPDFNEEDVIEALAEYQRRQRRFGAS